MKPISETHWQKIHRVVNGTSTIHQELKEKLILKVAVAKFITKIEKEFRNKLRIFFGCTVVLVRCLNAQLHPSAKTNIFFLSLTHYCNTMQICKGNAHVMWKVILCVFSFDVDVISLATIHWFRPPIANFIIS